MTSKDYILIAKVIMQVRRSYSPTWDSNLFRALDDVTRTLSFGLGQQNERFDPDKFMAACGYQTK